MCPSASIWWLLFCCFCWPNVLLESLCDCEGKNEREKKKPHTHNDHTIFLSIIFEGEEEKRGKRQRSNEKDASLSLTQRDYMHMYTFGRGKDLKLQTKALTACVDNFQHVILLLIFSLFPVMMSLYVSVSGFLLSCLFILCLFLLSVFVILGFPSFFERSNSLTGATHTKGVWETLACVLFSLFSLASGAWFSEATVFTAVVIVMIGKKGKREN